MKFLADECCNSDLVNALRQQGHDVLYVVESMRGATDDEVLSCAYAEDRILLTEDKDFGELVYRLRLPTKGLTLLRFEIADRRLKIARLNTFLKENEHRLVRTFVVLEKDKARFRPLPGLD